MGTHVAPETRANIHDLLEDCWEQRDDLPTAVNGWVPASVLVERSEKKRRTVGAALIQLADSGEVCYAQSIIPDQSGTIKTAAPAHAVEDANA